MVRPSIFAYVVKYSFVNRAGAAAKAQLVRCGLTQREVKKDTNFFCERPTGVCRGAEAGWTHERMVSMSLFCSDYPRQVSRGHFRTRLVVGCWLCDQRGGNARTRRLRTSGSIIDSGVKDSEMDEGLESAP